MCLHVLCNVLFGWCIYIIYILCILYMIRALCCCALHAFSVEIFVQKKYKMWCDTVKSCWKSFQFSVNGAKADKSRSLYNNRNDFNDFNKGRFRILMMMIFILWEWHPPPLLKRESLFLIHHRFGDEVLINFLCAATENIVFHGNEKYFIVPVESINSIQYSASTSSLPSLMNST